MVHPYISIDTTAAWKKMHFILSVRSDFHMTDSLLIAVHAFASRVFMSVSIDETLLPQLVNLSSSFRGPPFSVEMSPLWLKHMYSVLSTLTWWPMPPAALVPGYVPGIWLGRVNLPEALCHRRCPRLCRVSFASFLGQLKTVFYRRSKHEF